MRGRKAVSTLVSGVVLELGNWGCPDRRSHWWQR
jgi:hypothetical protein